jgi:hypothetical protein
MRPVLLALTLSILAFAAPAQASVPTNEPLVCFSSGEEGFALEGYLQLRVEPGGPAGYRFDRGFPEKKLVGDWNGEGNRGNVFVDGPLAGGRIDDAPAGTTMPGDQVEGRTWPLLLTSAGDATWYCRSALIRPRAVFGGEVSWVQKRTGIAVRLPGAIDQGSLSQTLDGVPFSSPFGRVRVATKGLWRLELHNGPCSGGPSECGSRAIFSAKRAPYRELLTLPKVKLAKGVRGRVGNVGCGPHPGPANWGPVYCGRAVIVWHQGKINYAMEALGADEDDLVRYANQVIRTG